MIGRGLSGPRQQRDSAAGPQAPIPGSGFVDHLRQLSNQSRRPPIQGAVDFIHTRKKWENPGFRDTPERPNSGILSSAKFYLTGLW